MKARRSTKPRQARKGRVEVAEAHRILQKRLRETGHRQGSPVANEFSYLDHVEPRKREDYPHHD